MTFYSISFAARAGIGGTFLYSNIITLGRGIRIHGGYNSNAIGTVEVVDCSSTVRIIRHSNISPTDLSSGASVRILSYSNRNILIRIIIFLFNKCYSNTFLFERYYSNRSIFIRIIIFSFNKCYSNTFFERYYSNRSILIRIIIFLFNKRYSNIFLFE